MANPTAPTENAIPAQGTLLQYNSGTVASPVWVTVTDRNTIDGPDGKVGDAEVTSLDSVAKEFLPGLPEAGDLSMTVWYRPSSTTHQFLWGLLGAPKVLLWRLLFADFQSGSNFIFYGYLNGFKPGGIEPGGYISADIKIKVTGLPILNQGS